MQGCTLLFYLEGGSALGVFLAPMAGVTDLAFRLIAREYGADLVVSEMISAQALVFGNKRTVQMLTTEEAERPVAIQLFGHKPGGNGRGRSDCSGTLPAGDA